MGTKYSGECWWVFLSIMHCTLYSDIPSCWDKKCNWWSSFLRQWITLNYLPFVLHKWLIIRAMYKIYNYIFTANKRTSLQFDTDNRITVYFVNCMVFLFPLFHNILLDFFNRKKNKKKNVRIWNKIVFELLK